MRVVFDDLYLWYENSFPSRSKTRDKKRCYLCSAYVVHMKQHLENTHVTDVFQCKVKNCFQPKFLEIVKVSQLENSYLSQSTGFVGLNTLLLVWFSLSSDNLCFCLTLPDNQPHGRQARQRAAWEKQHGPDPERAHLCAPPPVLLQVQEVQYALHRTDQGGRLQVGQIN